MFKPGQRVRIISKSFHGVCGTFTRYNQEDGWVFAIWDDNNREQKMPPDEVELASKFRLGDVVKLGKNFIEVDGIGQFNEKRAKLIARKHLI